jgi:hypothetical protein
MGSRVSNSHQAPFPGIDTLYNYRNDPHLHVDCMEIPLSAPDIALKMRSSPGLRVISLPGSPLESTLAPYPGNEFPETPARGPETPFVWAPPLLTPL